MTAINIFFFVLHTLKFLTCVKIILNIFIEYILTGNLTIFRHKMHNTLYRWIHNRFQGEYFARIYKQGFQNSFPFLCLLLRNQLLMQYFKKNPHQCNICKYHCISWNVSTSKYGLHTSHTNDDIFVYDTNLFRAVYKVVNCTIWDVGTYFFKLFTIAHGWAINKLSD